VTDDLLVAQFGIDLACFAGLGEEVLDLCSPLTRGPFVAFGEAGVGESLLPERDDQTASSRLVASSGRISRQHDRSAAIPCWPSVARIVRLLVWLDVVEGGRQQVLIGGEVRARAPWQAGLGGGRAHRGCVPAIPNDRSPRRLNELDSTLLMIDNLPDACSFRRPDAAGVLRRRARLEFGEQVEDLVVESWHVFLGFGLH
jgi:hypothetical protein